MHADTHPPTHTHTSVHMRAEQVLHGHNRAGCTHGNQRHQSKCYQEPGLPSCQCAIVAAMPPRTAMGVSSFYLCIRIEPCAQCSAADPPFHSPAKGCCLEGTGHLSLSRCKPPGSKAAAAAAEAPKPPGLTPPARPGDSPPAAPLKLSPPLPAKYPLLEPAELPRIEGAIQGGVLLVPAQLFVPAKMLVLATGDDPRLTWACLRADLRAELRLAATLEAMKRATSYPKLLGGLEPNTTSEPWRFRPRCPAQQ